METDGNAFILNQILDAQRLGNEIAYQQLRLARLDTNRSSGGQHMGEIWISDTIMNDLNVRLGQW